MLYRAVLRTEKTVWGIAVPFTAKTLTADEAEATARKFVSDSGGNLVDFHSEENGNLVVRFER